MAWHFLCMWIFALNGLLYVLYTVISGEWRYLLPNRNSFREAIHGAGLAANIRHEDAQWGETLGGFNGFAIER
jgi:thiosulfate reductase cytochrome b subunit